MKNITYPEKSGEMKTHRVRHIDFKHEHGFESLRADEPTGIHCFKCIGCTNFGWEVHSSVHCKNNL